MSDDAVAGIVDFLERDGLVVHRRGETLSVSSPDWLFAFHPEVHLPANLLRAYLEQMADEVGDVADRPAARRVPGSGGSAEVDERGGRCRRPHGCRSHRRRRSCARTAPPGGAPVHPR